MPASAEDRAKNPLLHESAAVAAAVSLGDIRFARPPASASVKNLCYRKVRSAGEISAEKRSHQITTLA